MKRLLIGVIAVAGLLGSVLAVAASVASPASAQSSSVDLLNVTTLDAADPVASQVIVTVQTVNNCNPGTGGSPIQDSYTLLGASDANTPGRGITGLISTNCNWEVSFRSANGLCGVSAQVKSDASTNVGNPETDGSLILSGLGGNSQAFRYSGTGTNPTGDVARIEFMITTNCSTSFTPTAVANTDLGDGAADDANKKYQNVQVAVSFAPVADSNDACTQAASLTLTFNDAGQATPSATDAAAISLINRPLGATADCSYDVTYAAEAGALRLSQEDLTAQVSDASKDASAKYVPITVQISVTSTFPTDEVFTTQDKVDYFINVDAPCGGYLGVIPQSFGSQGDVASAQVFPGSVTVYGAALNPISVDQTKAYTVEAYADGAGQMPCTVRVTERNGPERCVATGGDTQNRTYSAGTSVFAFEFNHTCTPAVATGGAVDAGGDDGGIPTPPTPPAIDLGGGTTSAGPAPEGQTG